MEIKYEQLFPLSGYMYYCFKSKWQCLLT